MRKAKAGDRRSVSWVIERFSPMLELQARYRLGASLRRRYDPLEIVHEVWAIALPRLTELDSRDGRHTPVLVKFLSTTLLQQIQNLRRREQQRSEQTQLDPEAREAGGAQRAMARSVVEQASHSELSALIRERLERLPERDAELILLRSFEQRSAAETAEILGGEPNTLVVAYRRALERLRKELPASLFEELTGDPFPTR